MYTRGQFAVMGNVGRKALRLYHEEGLLVPVSVNKENGYHYYDESQLETLEKIKRLRKFGLSLYEIRQILDGNVREEVVIESKIKETDNALKMMKKLAVEGGSKETSFDDKPDIRSLECGTCIYIEENVDLEELGMSVGKLYERASREHLTVAGSHLVRYEGLLNEEGFKMITCLPVLDHHGEKTMEIKEDDCLHLKFCGGFSKVSEAHSLIERYAKDKNLKLSDRAYEVYNNDMSVDVYYTID